MRLPDKIWISCIAYSWKREVKLQTLFYLPATNCDHVAVESTTAAPQTNKNENEAELSTINEICFHSFEQSLMKSFKLPLFFAQTLTGNGNDTTKSWRRKTDPIWKTSREVRCDYATVKKPVKPLDTLIVYPTHVQFLSIPTAARTVQAFQPHGKSYENSLRNIKRAMRRAFKICSHALRKATDSYVQDIQNENMQANEKLVLIAPTYWSFSIIYVDRRAKKVLQLKSGRHVLSYVQNIWNQAF